MKYLTKTEFKTAVGDLERSIGGWGNKVKFYSETGIKLIDMKPGIIYLFEANNGGFKYIALSKDLTGNKNKKWVGIFDSKDLPLNLTRVYCSYYSYYSTGIAEYAKVYEHITPLTYKNMDGTTKYTHYGGDGGYRDFYMYGQSMNLEFMNWTSNPLEGN
tara:strand:+ start:205 stop:681 length:477 start_codon:yes stop_codon:yes gene_type:complete